MPSAADRLFDELRSTGTRIAKILDSARFLEEDIYLMQEEGFHIHFCIDFFDLRAYLSLATLPPNSRANDVLNDDAYARILLFNRLERPIVLLPQYYLEFRNNIARYFGSKREATAERRLWVDGLVSRLRRVMSTLADVASELERAQDSDSVEQLSRAESAATEAVDTVAKSLGVMEDARLAAGLLKRFDLLVSKGRLQGLRSTEAGVLMVERGKIYDTARAFLDGWRRKTIANETDALALSVIHSLNKDSSGRKHLYYLVSSAPVMRDLVQHLSSQLGNEEGRVELRDMEYWRLWFAISDASPTPTLERIREFRAKISSQLEGLARRNSQLRHEYKNALHQGEGRVLEAALREISGYLYSFRAAMEEVVAPLRGRGRSLLVLEDILSPLNDDDASVNAALERIRFLIKECAANGHDLSALLRILRDLLLQLEHLVWFLEGEATGDAKQPMIQESEFCSGFVLRDTDWTGVYKDLLLKAESYNGEVVREVFQELSDLARERPRESASFQRYVVAARAYLREGAVKSAERELEWVDSTFHRDPEYLLTKGLILERTGRHDEAQRIFEDLLVTYDEPVIRLHLAWLLQRKARLLEDPDLAELCLLQAALVRDRLEPGASPQRIEASLIYFNTLADLAGRKDREEELKGGLKEVEDLLGAIEKQGLTQEFGQSLKSLQRRLKRLIAARTHSKGEGSVL